MKSLLVIGLCIGLLFATVESAAAEILFGVSGEVGKTDFTADYDGGGHISKSPNALFLNGSLNLLGTHVSLEYGTSDMNKYAFTTTDLRVGWDFGPKLLKVKAFGGYQQLGFRDDSLGLKVDNTYRSLVGGLGFESRFDKFTIYGTGVIPAFTRFSNGDQDDDEAKLSYTKIGVAYSPLPTLDFFLNYRNLKADSDVLDIRANTYSAGLKFSF